MRYIFTVCVAIVLVFLITGPLRAGEIVVTATDMTASAPLANPTPSSYQPRYISGFGSGDSFTIFYEDRDSGDAISYVSTTSGPTGFPPGTATNIADTHFCVKPWPITVDGTRYLYRAWAAVGNNEDHHFYVSNDLQNWTLVSTFTISNAPKFLHPGYVYYAFHDVIKLNETYYAWGECNIGYTLMCRSDNGADDWEAFAKVGGLYTLPGVGPLGLPDVGTPTGSFFELGAGRGYGKIMVPGDDSAFYLAVNTAAKPSLPPDQLEAAFIDPANWAWHDGTTGLPSTPILSDTLSDGGHDCRECWLVPNPGSTEWTIIYDADFGSADGGKALGYATLSAPVIQAAIDIEPDTLNLKSKGKWITCYIALPEGHDVTDIDLQKVRLQEDIEPAWGWPDEDLDVLMVKFPRAELQDMLEPGGVELTVTGELVDEMRFEGTDTIRVIKPGGKKK